jgi:hypothetical protein
VEEVKFQVDKLTWLCKCSSIDLVYVSFQVHSGSALKLAETIFAADPLLQFCTLLSSHTLTEGLHCEGCQGTAQSENSGNRCVIHLHTFCKG